ncbi:polysaccharide deacetylase family protein [Bacillus sp. SCS-153A]|uniref:polysaccharide deacetylase family protein n=1 Tax=Rossellomorea sedimentorum TaxID=3115294 RepID=UPI003906D3D6
MQGKFIISLDFELYWGVHDVFTIKEYRENLLGAREVIPEMLRLFKEFDIRATWATVGLLFFHTKEELLPFLPEIKPAYFQEYLSPYSKLDEVGPDELKDPYHFASSLVDLIAKHPEQEIATHTFSHYYCLESGQDVNAFEADLLKAVEVAKSKNISLTSIVFPRNQVNEQYLSICKQYNISAYRGNEKSKLYSPVSYKKSQSPLYKILRFIDSYVNLTGHHLYSLSDLPQKPIINLPSSRFLRPYNSTLQFFEPLKLKRIKNSMTKAAKENKIYHLWWHPHNFGQHPKESMEILRKICLHYAYLQETYGMQSMTMDNISRELSRDKVKGIHPK